MNKSELPIEENTPDLEKVNFWMREAVSLLETAWEIDHLSNNELFIIKKITEDVIHREIRNSDSWFQINREIATRFLIEAYGLDPYIIKTQTKTDEEMEGFLEYIRRTRERAHLI